MIKLQPYYKFLMNPTIIDGNRVYANIARERGFYKRYEYLIGFHKNFKFEIFVENPFSIYYIFEIPSELAGNTYDVIIRFIPNSKIDIEAKSIKNYKIQIFTNCPSFTYEFANVYINKGLLIPWLKDKFPKEVITGAPKEKNPNSAIGYDHTIFHALKYLQGHEEYLEKSYIDKISKEFIIGSLYKTIRPSSLTEEQFIKTKKLKRVGRKFGISNKKETIQDKEIKDRKGVETIRSTTSTKPTNDAKSKTIGQPYKKATDKISTINKIKPRKKI